MAVRALGTAVLTERLDGTSRMNREVHVRICGGGQVRSLPATRQLVGGKFGRKRHNVDLSVKLPLVRNHSQQDWGGPASLRGGLSAVKGALDARGDITLAA